LYCGDSHDQLANLPTKPMRFPLRHPPEMEHNREADQFFIDRILVPDRRQKAGQWRKWLRSLRKKCAFRTRLGNLMGAGSSVP
ncbi:MAG TPA: hypothetical protein VFC07_09275, partial [Verrucomicrobiae bacterium]|nr:hypothetical protein [Verrucomicrobiae bacterium]